MIEFPEERLIEVVSVLENNNDQVEVGGGICFGIYSARARRVFVPCDYGDFSEFILMAKLGEGYSANRLSGFREIHPRTRQIGQWVLPKSYAYIDMEKNQIGFDDNSSKTARKHKEAIRSILVDNLGLA